MHGDDPQYFRRVGKIITSRGDAEQVSASSFIFSSSSLPSSLALLDYRQDETKSVVEERAIKVREALAPFIGKGMTPNSMVDFLFSSYTTEAMQGQQQQRKSELFGAHFDAGSMVFQGIGGRDGWNIIDTPVTVYSEYSKITPLDVILLSFTKNESHRERRKRIVADAISVISGMAMQILQITQGRVTYIPLVSCVYVAAISKTDKIVLLVNDPTGQGWKILPTREVNYNDASELLEFSVKNVTGSLFDQFKINVFSSGTLTSEGTGTVTVVDKNLDVFNQILLEEGRLYIDGSTNIITVNVVPTKIEEEQAARSIRRGNDHRRKSPSVFSWFNFKGNRNPTVIDVSGSDIGEDEYDLLPFKRKFTGAVCKSTSKRICRIADKGDWTDQLLRLEKFTKRSDYKEKPYRKRLENLATSIGLVTFLGNRDDNSGDNAVASYATTDTDDEYIKAAYSLIDFNGEIGVNLLPIMERSSKNDIICFSVIGNSPNSQSTRVVRFLKRATRPPAGRSCSSSSCTWTNVAPTSIVSTGNGRQFSKEEGDNKMEPVFVYTPRCLFHSLTASIHMFSDSEGPIDSMDLGGKGYRLTLDSNNTTNIPVESIVNLVIKPLVTAAVSSTLQRNIVVNGNQVARPLELFVARVREDDDQEYSADDDGDGRRIMTEPHKKSDIRFMISMEGDDTKEFMDDKVLKNIRWYETQTWSETSPPECLLQKVDDRGRVLNMVLTEITVEGAKPPSAECAEAGELAVNTMKMKCSSRNTRYPCPHGKTLIKYGLLASSGAMPAFEEKTRTATKESNDEEEINSNGGDNGSLKIFVAMAQ